MESKKIEYLKEIFDLEELQATKVKVRTFRKIKHPISTKKMKEIIEKQSGRLDQILSTYDNETQTKDAIILTGFADLDRLMGGLRVGELIVVGARPSVGKTAFLLSMAKNISFAETATSVLYINLESTLRHTADRLALMIKEEEEISSVPFYISAPNHDMESIINEIYDYIEQSGVKVILIDYIQMLDIPDNTQRNRNLSSALKTLKQVSKDKQVSIVLASQLNRSVELRSGYPKHYYLSDLRDSGSLEQETDKVIFLNRLEYYGFLEDENRDNTVGGVDIVLAKNRTGYTGEVSLRFIKESVNFECWPSSDSNWGELNTDLIF